MSFLDRIFERSSRTAPASQLGRRQGPAAEPSNPVPPKPDSHGPSTPTVASAQTQAAARQRALATARCRESEIRGEPPKGNGAARPPRVKDPNVTAALRAVDGSSATISKARDAIASGTLTQKERASSYKFLNECVGYRNQRNTPGIGDTMCNVTSMAMAFNGLGVGKSETKVEFEHALAKQMGSMGLKRTEEKHRESLAAKYGVQASTHYTPKQFANGRDAHDWYAKNVIPRLERGDQATMSVHVKGASGHVMRVEWADEKGLVVDDPYGMFGGTNGTTSQGGNGNSRLIPWDTVAQLNAGKYVQVYSK